MSAPARVRVGAIGAGWWATTNHFPLLAERADVELVSVCRPDHDVLLEVQERFGFQHATEQVEELLEQDLDAVVVTTPHHLHLPHATAALDRGLHVLCEKPMTLRAADAWHLVDRVAATGVQFLVPYGWHYTPFIVETKRLVDDGVLGEIEFVHSFMASPTKGFFGGTGPVPSDWKPSLVEPDRRTWQDPARGGGYTHGQLTHSTALMFWLTGLRAASVTASQAFAQSAVDMYVAADVAFTNGAVGSIGGAATLPDDDKFQIDLRVFGTEGVLLLDVERERAEIRRHDGRRIEVDAPAGAGAYRCDVPPQRFIDLIVGASTENNSPVEVAARSVELLEAIQQSAALGGAIQIGETSPMKPRPGGEPGAQEGGPQ